MKNVQTMVWSGAASILVGCCAGLASAGDSKSIALENGSGDTGYVRVARSPSLEPQQFTIDVTFRPDGPGLGNVLNAGGAAIVAKPRVGTSGTFLSSWYMGWSSTTNRVEVSVSNNGSTIGAKIQSNSLVFTGQTVRATLSFDGQTLRLYFNGCLDSELSTDFSSVYYGSDDVLIGAGNFASGFLRRFDGIIDELTIWSEALDAAQIEELNPAGAGDSLVGWWMFDGDSLADLSGNGNDGVAVDNVTFAAPPEFSCAADLNGDGVTNLSDLSILLSQFGLSSCIDTNGDGVLDLIDLSIILNAFGNDCP